MPHTSVIDLSHHNRVPKSFMAAKAAGVLGVIHKMTEGMGGVDAKCAGRFALASESEMLWGLYHFLRPGNMKDQVDHFLATAVEHGVLNDNTLLAADYEDKRISISNLTEFMMILEARSGRKPVLYSGHVLKEKLKDLHPELNEYRLWLAHYNIATPKVPTGWSNYWLWQFTDKGTATGITPPTDCNQYLGTADQLRSEWAGGYPPPKSEPQSGSKIVRVIVPDGVEVRIEKE